MGDGWHPDPFGRWDHRYFDGVEWTAQVSYAGESFGERMQEPTPVGDLLMPGEALLFDVAALSELHDQPSGRLALTRWRAVLYQTGKSTLRSSVLSGGSLTVHWSLAFDWRYLRHVREAATAGDRRFEQLLLRDGVPILSAFSSTPVIHKGKRERESGVGRTTMTFWRERIRDATPGVPIEDAPPAPTQARGGVLDSYLRGSEKVASFLMRPANAQAERVAREEAKRWETSKLLLVGDSRELTRIDEVLKTAAGTLRRQ